MRDAALVAASLISFQVKHTDVGGMVVSYHTYHRVFITILFQLPVASPRFKLVACSCQVWYTDSKKIPSEVQHDDGCRETHRRRPVCGGLEGPGRREAGDASLLAGLAAKGLRRGRA